jgi:NAD(P)-dependent dehydrogenase (short-subunit alcohol dehydrogenase family)
MSGRLAGKVCVVAGTGGSMGRATALTFAREGANVVGCDVAVEPAGSTVAMVHDAGGQMVSLQPCRLNDPAECARLVELAISEFGRIDVLFNLAARTHFGWLENVTDDDWDAARRDEVDLVLYLTRAAWPHLKASRGVVVNMASLNGSLSFKQVFSAGVASQLATVRLRASFVLALGTISMLVGLVLLVTAVRLSAPSLALFLISGALIGAGAGAVFKGTTGIVLEAGAPQDRLAMTSALLIALYVGLSVPVIGAGIALDQGASAPDTVLGFAILVGLGITAAGRALLIHRPKDRGTLPHPAPLAAPERP